MMNPRLTKRCWLFATLACFTLGCQGQTAPSPGSAVVAQVAATETASDGDSGNDWPHFLGPTYDGKSAERGIRSDWTQKPPRLLWSQTLGTSYGIGSVAAGRYYQLDRYGDSERLTCFEAETGKEQWRFELPVDYEDMYGYNNGPRSSPAIDGESVYTLGVAGRLACVTAADGQLVWQRSLNEEFGVVQNFFGVGTSPIVIGDSVIVMVGGSPAEDARVAPGQLDRVSSNGTALVAFDKRTGEERWRAGDDLASYSVPRPVEIAGEPAVLLFARGGLLAVDPRDGKTLWHFPWRANRLESVNAAVPVVRGDEVLISECYDIGSALLRMRRDGYDVLWQDGDNRREHAMRAHWATPIEHQGYVYGCSGRNPPDSDLRCIEWKTGKPKWVDPRRIRSSLMLVDGHLLVLEETGLLQCLRLNPERMEVVGELDLAAVAGPDGRPLLAEPCWAAPILSHGLLFLRGANRVVCFDLRD